MGMLRPLTRPALGPAAASGRVTGTPQAVPELAASAPAAPHTTGAAGIGDRYYPNYGNGGYRVGHYGIRVAFQPRTERLEGVTRIRARATQRLTRFNLDLVLKPSRVRVNGELARFRHRGHELSCGPIPPSATDLRFGARSPKPAYPRRR